MNIARMALKGQREELKQERLQLTTEWEVNLRSAKDAIQIALVSPTADANMNSITVQVAAAATAHTRICRIDEEIAKINRELE